MRSLLLAVFVCAVLVCPLSRAYAIPPAPPYNLQLIYRDPGFELVWDMAFNPDVLGFLAYRSTEPGFPVGPETIVVDVGMTIMWVDHEADSDGCYYWRVTAYNYLGEQSDPSGVVAWLGSASAVRTTSWGNIKALYR